MSKDSSKDKRVGWLRDLKPGDEVGVIEKWHSVSSYIHKAKVLKISDTGRITIERNQNNSTEQIVLSPTGSRINSKMDSDKISLCSLAQTEKHNELAEAFALFKRVSLGLGIQAEVSQEHWLDVASQLRPYVEQWDEMNGKMKAIINEALNRD
jgi:hypothetical protein